MWEKLKAIDPEMAAQLHPNDHRKISRSLEVYETYNMKHSDLIAIQKKEGIENICKYDALMIWLTCVQQNMLSRF